MERAAVAGGISTYPVRLRVTKAMSRCGWSKPQAGTSWALHRCAADELVCPISPTSSGAPERAVPVPSGPAGPTARRGRPCTRGCAAAERPGQGIATAARAPCAASASRPASTAGAAAAAASAAAAAAHLSLPGTRRRKRRGARRSVVVSPTPMLRARRTGCWREGRRGCAVGWSVAAPAAADSLPSRRRWLPAHLIISSSRRADAPRRAASDARRPTMVLVVVVMLLLGGDEPSGAPARSLAERGGSGSGSGSGSGVAAPRLSRIGCLPRRRAARPPPEGAALSRALLGAPFRPRPGPTTAPTLPGAPPPLAPRGEEEGWEGGAAYPEARQAGRRAPIPAPAAGIVVRVRRGAARRAGRGVGRRKGLEHEERGRRRVGARPPPPKLLLVGLRSQPPLAVVRAPGRAPAGGPFPPPSAPRTGTRSHARGPKWVPTRPEMGSNGGCFGVAVSEGHPSRDGGAVAPPLLPVPRWHGRLSGGAPPRPVKTAFMSMPSRSEAHTGRLGCGGATPSHTDGLWPFPRRAGEGEEGVGLHRSASSDIFPTHRAL
eukprot:scaffold21_cov368-Prasinococcus_capsulatus_cf.AAC.11